MKILMQMLLGAVAPMVYMAADGVQGGSSQAAGDTSQTGDSGLDAEGKTQAGKSEADGKSQTQTENPEIDYKKEFEALSKSHKEQAAKWRKREEEDEKAKTDALKEQGKYKDLYDKANSELTSIKPKLEQYEASLKKFLDAELKTVPEALAKLIPETDIIGKLEWLSKAKESGAFVPTKATGDGSAPPGGVNKGGLEAHIKI